jgi:ribosomal protein L17
MEDMMKILSHPDHMETTIKKVKTLNGELDRLVELKDSLDANNKDDLYFGLNSSGVQPDAETESKVENIDFFYKF